MQTQIQTHSSLSQHVWGTQIRLILRCICANTPRRQRVFIFDSATCVCSFIKNNSIIILTHTRSLLVQGWRAARLRHNQNIRLHNVRTVIFMRHKKRVEGQGSCSCVIGKSFGAFARMARTPYGPRRDHQTGGLRRELLILLSPLGRRWVGHEMQIHAHCERGAGQIGQVSTWNALAYSVDDRNGHRVLRPPRVVT